MTYAARLSRSVTAYEASDKSALRAFQRAHFGVQSRQCDDTFSDWLFERNPHREADTPVFWVCKRDGVIVGQQGCLPVVLRVDGREFRASWGVDLMIHPDWRIKGVAPALSAAYERSGDILMGLGMSPAAHKTYARAGWTDLGRLPFLVRPLDARACLQAAPRAKWLAAFASDAIVGGSARVMAAMANRLEECSLYPVDRFDERIDGIWAACTGDYRVVVKRDFNSVRWRFDLFPDRARYERFYVKKASRVIGYAVIRLDAWRGHRVVRIVDWIVERRSQKALFALLIGLARERGVAAVFIEVLHEGSRPLLRSVGCFTAAAVTQFMVKVRSSAAALSDTLTEPGSWLVTRADSDSDIPITENGDSPATPAVV